MIETSLDKLDKRIRPLADQLLGLAEQAGIRLRVINTLRTHEQQASNIANGVSWTKHSLHLPQPPDGLSLAFDVCPIEYLAIKNWNPTGPKWWIIAELGVSLGLGSGMDWHDVGIPPIGETRRAWDPGHFDLRAARRADLLALKKPIS